MGLKERICDKIKNEACKFLIYAQSDGEGNYAPLNSGTVVIPKFAGTVLIGGSSVGDTLFDTLFNTNTEKLGGIYGIKSEVSTLRIEGLQTRILRLNELRSNKNIFIHNIKTTQIETTYAYVANNFYIGMLAMPEGTCFYISGLTVRKKLTLAKSNINAFWAEDKIPVITELTLEDTTINKYCGNIAVNSYKIDEKTKIPDNLRDLLETGEAKKLYEQLTTDPKGSRL